MGPAEDDHEEEEQGSDAGDVSLHSIKEEDETEDEEEAREHDQHSACDELLETETDAQHDDDDDDSGLASGESHAVVQEANDMEETQRCEADAELQAFAEVETEDAEDALAGKDEDELAGKDEDELAGKDEDVLAGKDEDVLAFNDEDQAYEAVREAQRAVAAHREEGVAGALIEEQHQDHQDHEQQTRGACSIAF